MRSYAPTSLMSEYMLKLFGILLHGTYIYFPTFIYLFNHCLYQYGLMNISFILWFVSTITLFILLFKLFQLWPFGALLVVCVCVCMCLSISLFSDPTRCSRIILCISWPSPAVSYFFRRVLFPFVGEWC